MPPTIDKSSRSMEVRTLENIRPQSAKAGLHPTHESDLVRSSDPIGRVIGEAVVKHYGSVKAASISLHVDPSLMQREFDAGRVGRLDGAEDAWAVKAAVSEALANAYGQLQSPKDRARHTIRKIEEGLVELKQFVEVA